MPIAINFVAVAYFVNPCVFSADKPRTATRHIRAPAGSAQYPSVAIAAAGVGLRLQRVIKIAEGYETNAPDEEATIPVVKLVFNTLRTMAVQLGRFTGEDQIFLGAVDAALAAIKFGIKLV